MKNKSKKELIQEIEQLQRQLQKASFTNRSDFNELQKRAKEKAEEREEFIKRLIDSSADCIKVIDLEGNLLSMSIGGQKLLEIDDINKYLNKSWVDFWKTEDQIKVLNAISIAKSGQKGIFTAYCETTKGTPKWWEVIITPAKDTKGEIEKLLAISRDITVQKNNESEIIVAKEEAEQSERYLDNIINHIGDPVFVKDEQSRLLLVNDAFCTLFELSKAKIINKTLTEKVAPEEVESFLKIDKQVLSSGKENINEEMLTLNNKKTKIISTRKSRFIDNEGNKYLIGTIRDITSQKEAQNELSLYRNKLEKMVKKRTKDLEDKNLELDTALKIFVGREIKIRELEKTIIKIKKIRGLQI